MPKIRRLLVANRGEIAVRIMRSAHALDISTVALFSDPDVDAPHVALAEVAVHLPGAAPSETYLRGDLIVQAALATGADAIHPGYGFLSENADFARRCAEAGIVFVGPPVAAIEAMGSKIAAKALMQAAGVPVLPGTVIDHDDASELVADAARVGYPLLVKASMGGGGRGMRIVRAAEDVVDAVRSARREAQWAFGDGTVFLERFVERPRHVEVQIFGDQQGTVTHLFERECSIQRRFQKIIEEAPSPAVDEDLRKQLCAAAVDAGKAIGYVNAGTVEFVLAPDGQFYFLEVNTRLQVEHPVTEEVTGIDLVALQLAIAEGRPLPPAVLSAHITGHALEARLYAEDPEADYAPGGGTILSFEFPPLPGIRVDTGVGPGSVIGTRYDPMLAKVIAHADTRESAARLLARALNEARIHGVATNRDLLVAILREESFLAGDIDTGYLERTPPDVLVAPVPERTLRLHACAVALSLQRRSRSAAGVQRTIPPGFRNVPSQPQRVALDISGRRIQVEYRLVGSQWWFAVDGETMGERINVEVRAPAVALEVDGRRFRHHVTHDRDLVHCDGLGSSTSFRLIEKLPAPVVEAAPGSLFANMPGTVVRVNAAAGQVVDEGEVIVVFEAMKMEHSIRAPAGGLLTEILVAVGETVEVGDLLAVIKETEGGELP